MGNAKYDIKIITRAVASSMSTEEAFQSGSKKIANYKKVVYSIYYFTR